MRQVFCISLFNALSFAHSHIHSIVSIYRSSFHSISIYLSLLLRMSADKTVSKEKLGATKRSHLQYSVLKIAFPFSCSCFFFFLNVNVCSVFDSYVCVCTVGTCTSYAVYFEFITRLLHCRYWAICHFSLCRIHISVTYTYTYRGTHTRPLLWMQFNTFHSSFKYHSIPFLYHQNVVSVR